MRPQELTTKIFLDSANPQDTKAAIETIGFLDGQTTNPSLLVKHPDLASHLVDGKIRREELLSFYKEKIKEINRLIPAKSISIEVYADMSTPSEEMIRQARDMYFWVPNAHIKLPTTHQGLEAADTLSNERMRLNLTLCFTQEQAAAIYVATDRAQSGPRIETLSGYRDVFVSPFIGRLDDKGMRGIDLIRNIQRMYADSDRHVGILAASVRSLAHLLIMIAMKVDMVTVPLSVLKEWKDAGMTIPTEVPADAFADLQEIPYQEIDLSTSWRDMILDNPLTEAGLEKFADDWNAIIKR